jgi:hypothetical protein
LQAVGRQKLGISILRQHTFVAELLPRIHRFCAIDREGLFALAKDVARITADDIDEKALQTLVVPPKGERWGSLKSLEKMLGQKIPAEEARKMLSVFAGIYDLRLADAHLPSDTTQDAIGLAGIDETRPYVQQGFQLLDGAVSTLYRIAGAIDKMW